MTTAMRKENLLNEVVSMEKQLTASILSKGILHSDVKDLYYKVCSIYERIFMNDHEELELQDVEYSLWKLHYMHIDEFRKRIKRGSLGAENPKSVITQNANDGQRSNSNHTAEFRSFLSETMQFYQKLISKIREHNGLPKEGLLYKTFGISKAIEPKKKKKYQFLCHRLLVCLGDLARYMEQYEKPDIRSHNWLAAATHYLEAAMVWPDSGNPQNQLAVLATYVDDEFLALYHCMRSFAVKEPFPDAWNNLILLFEKNRSSLLHSLSKDVQFNFSTPSEKCCSRMISQIGDDRPSLERDLFSLLIRTLGFFFIKSSLEEFTIAFSSMMRRLDELMSLDDSELNASLEAYKLLDSVRTGPFRAIQIVSVFIFMLQDRFSKTDINDVQQLELTQLALAATFIVTGRLVERCLKACQLDSFPLLPAVLIFVEWLVNLLDEVERYGFDEKGESSMSYFFGVFVNLLERLNVKTAEEQCSLTIPLWEDYELRGFTPVAFSHEPLAFSSHWEHMDSFKFGAKHRAYRIVVIATKISDRANGSTRWIIHDKSQKVFYTAEPNELPDKKALESVKPNIPDPHLEEPTREICEATEGCEKDILEEVQNQNHLKKKPVPIEDEEVILFKPLMRYNSAPIYSYITEKDEVLPREKEDETISSDECLRRATSLLIAQNPGQSDYFAFHTDTTNFSRNKLFEQHDTFEKDTGVPQIAEASISAGHPSLNAWVLNRGNFSTEREKGTSNFTKHVLPPIEELAPKFINGLGLGDNESSAVSPGPDSRMTYSFSPPSPPLYSAPAPSAPFLPDDAVLFNGVLHASISSNKISGDINQNITSSNAFRGSDYSNWTASHGTYEYSPSITGFTNTHPPSHRMTSAEWLRQYRENLNIERDNNQVWAAPYNASGNLLNFQRNDIFGYDHLYQTGHPSASNPTMYMESPLRNPAFPVAYDMDASRKDSLFPGYQRANFYGCGVATDMRSELEQPPLLQYLKEKEWQLQKDTHTRSATYMGN